LRSQQKGVDAMARTPQPFVVHKRKDTKTLQFSINYTCGLQERICAEWQRKSFQNLPAELALMEENQEFDAEFRVRLPSALAERIAETAQKERRSRKSQYVYMLEEWFEMKKGLEKRVRNLEALAAKEADAEREKGKKKTG